jgi:hypothetical protein
MSIATRHSAPEPRSDIYDCKHEPCTGVVTPVDAIEGYCSRECQLRDRGQRLLNLIQHDHRFCYTCFRKLKEVYNVPEWRRRRIDPVTESVVTGFQYRTEHAEFGQQRRRRPGTLPDDTQTGTICECGQTNHGDRDELLQSSSIKTAATNLHATLEAFRAEGQHTSRIDFEELVDVLYAQYQHDESYDFALAVGIATTDDDR